MVLCCIVIKSVGLNISSGDREHTVPAALVSQRSGYQ